MSNDKNNLVYREQLDDNVIEMLSEDIGSNYSLRTENTKTIVASLNEILGKDIISNAVGSPLVFDDTFEVMGEKIKGLTSSFKNALLRLGISVSSVDKFEKLIEKLELYVDENASDADVEEALLESLKQTLIEKGVELNGNESLIELIVKVGELKPVNYSGGLNIISANELPENGEENQICIITDNPMDRYLITCNVNEVINDGFTVCISDNTACELISLVNNNITSNYRISYIFEGSKNLLSYVYKNGVWKQITTVNVIVFDNGNYPNSGITGNLVTGTYHKVSNGLYTARTDFSMMSAFSLNKPIDFTYFKTLRVVMYASNSINVHIGMNSTKVNATVSYTTARPTFDKYVSKTAGTSEKTFDIDISSWTGEGYLAFSNLSGDTSYTNLYIKYIELI